ncbi:hypothetical protein GQ602_000263 [Ophiocordyceps camponoti-floridani]|uniref:Uncharacterized protein n=1 Tax=Ophiocordyceps camponoti-floridani TaxID=2030778 RepID=A0A8H4QBR5_9HYPO|nr:hypothetical protein GQ602_000263 [Ophiocordyceps camponoti-floridani]
MALSRAFTTRRLRLSSSAADGGKQSRHSSSVASSSLRHKISAPIELLSTTNMLSYNAPDIFPRSSPVDSINEDSNTESTPPTSPEVNGKRSPSPQPNHLTLYFKNPAKSMELVEGEKPPQIPKRSPSHTKKNSFDAIARSRSVSRLSRDSDVSLSIKAAQSFSRSPSTSTRASSVSHISASKQATAPQPVAAASPPSDCHPFGQELAKVKELAEEYNADHRLPVIDEEQQYLEARGLVKLSADDYLGAIQSLASAFFLEGKHAAAGTPVWI